MASAAGLLLLLLCLAVCANAQIPSCIFSNAYGTVDLSPLAGQTYLVPNTAFTMYTEHIALCGTYVSTPGCPANSAACEVHFTAGSKVKVSIYPATLATNSAGDLQMTYTPASSCQNIVITFYCDSTGAVGVPVYVNESCVMQLKWTTKYACFVPHPNPTPTPSEATQPPSTNPPPSQTQPPSTNPPPSQTQPPSTNPPPSQTQPPTTPPSTPCPIPPPFSLLETVLFGLVVILIIIVLILSLVLLRGRYLKNQSVEGSKVSLYFPQLEPPTYTALETKTLQDNDL